MNLILVDSPDFCADNRVILNDQRFRQITKIHQSREGDTVKIGQLNGMMGVGVIERIDTNSVELKLTLDTPPPSKLPLSIVLALPRPKMIRRIFRTVAELGVSELTVINSYKVEKSYWQSPALSEQRVREYLIDGLQQAKDTVIPPVHFYNRFKPFVEDILPSKIAGRRALLAHPNTGHPCPLAISEPTTLAIGPEGGFTDYEANKLLDLGFEGIHLGERILKVENALIALVSKLY